MTSAGIEMKEPEEFKQAYDPGIDYGDAEALEDVERRQFLVRDFGYRMSTLKALNNQRRHKYRPRPIPAVEPLVQPIWP